MPMKSFLLLSALSFSLSGCLASDAERGLAGAAGGAVVGGVTGGNPVTGAVIGGAAGYFCRDLNVPPNFNTLSSESVDFGSLVPMISIGWARRWRKSCSYMQVF